MSLWVLVFVEKKKNARESTFWGDSRLTDLRWPRQYSMVDKPHGMVEAPIR